ncbi:CaiB/BaiF CoA transferase family protein [Chelatococcus reniformis]|uniref:CoA transferase n=1 Tax=Chelatococcus reniformis TaxID=1494448 RepID=A0A916XKG5_9HYPH|nr:CaiB/BaiF CoA-transferase family protein [Chelatococcus reniformis]GGC78003.1 CoA transferase [Chelatococcus reniformis]
MSTTTDSDASGGIACRGLRVIDTSRVLAGPFCGTILADLGADVIRVEHPVQMDEVRSWSPVVDGVAAAFIAVNHSKRGIAIDLAQKEGQEIFRRLLATADVLIDNYRPGTLERFGFGRGVIEALNPRLVHCAIRAFPTGTSAEALPGYEASIQAYSGIMAMTGEPDGEPVRCGPSVVDMSTGLVATIAILAALRERDVTGRGGRVEPALLRTATNLMGFQLASYAHGGVPPRRQGSGHASLVPYGTFHTADGPVLLAASNDRLWARLWDVLEPDAGAERPYPTLAERAAARAAVNQLVAAKVAGWSRDALLAALIAAGVPAAPVQTLPEYMADPTLEHAGVLERIALPRARDIQIAGRLFGADAPLRPRRPPPELGEHTMQILADLGYGADERERLERAGVVS